MADNKEEALARWRGLVADQISSGKSVAAFCRDHGLREWQLYEWKKRLRGCEATPFIVVEISSSEAPVQLKPYIEESSRIELRHRRGWSLIVAPGFDASKRSKLPS